VFAAQIHCTLIVFALDFVNSGHSRIGVGNHNQASAANVVEQVVTAFGILVDFEHGLDAIFAGDLIQIPDDGGSVVAGDQVHGHAHVVFNASPKTVDDVVLLGFGHRYPGLGQQAYFLDQCLQ